MRSIEVSIFKSETLRNSSMKEYYYYWERRIYNALVKMVLRGLLSYKNLI
jgi:dynein heavy chain